MVKIKSRLCSNDPHIRSILNVLSDNTRDINNSNLGFFGFKPNVTKMLLKGRPKNACHRSRYLSKMVKIESSLCSNDPHIRSNFIVFSEHASYNNLSNLRSLEFSANVTKMLCQADQKMLGTGLVILAKWSKLKGVCAVMIHTLGAFSLYSVRKPVTITILTLAHFAL
jgi:hypothetical protein